MLDRAPEKVLLYAFYWQKALKLAMFLGREIQESLISDHYTSLLARLRQREHVL